MPQSPEPEIKPPWAHWSWLDAGMQRNAWVMWAILLTVICAMIGFSKKPMTDRSVTGNYRQACVAWWERKPMYRIDNPDDIDGFLYFPQAAILHTPFSFGPPKAGEILWRITILGLFTAGVWRLARLGHPHDRPAYFAVISLLSIFSVAGNLKNGQSNLVMAGTMMLAAADLGGKNWWRAAFWLVLGFLFKPLGAVMLLLVAAIYFREMAWRLAVGLVIGATIPFLTAPPDYAWGQHIDFVTKMRSAGAPNRMFADIRGMVETYAGPVVGDRAYMALRGLMALVTLGLAWHARRKLGDRLGALAIVCGATVYLMLFNPRTEGLGYAALAPIMGLFFCWAVWERRNIAVALWLLVSCVMFGLEFELVTKHMQGTMLGMPGWFKPPMALLFMAYLIYLLSTAKCTVPASGGGADEQRSPARVE